MNDRLTAEDVLRKLGMLPEEEQPRRIRIDLHTDDGQIIDVTEAVQIVYDSLHASMDFGSGFLDTRELQAMRLLATAAGWELP